MKYIYIYSRYIYIQMININNGAQYMEETERKK